MSAFVGQSSVDTTAPAISNITVCSIQSSSATITWSTHGAATSQVEYGTTAAYGSISSLDSSLLTSHSQTLTGLSASALYNYRVISKDVSGNQTISANFTFTTVADTTSASSGQWSAVMNWPLVAVHTALVNTGKVLMWDAWDTGGTASVRVWDPVNQTFTSVPTQFSQIFCSAQVSLSDGRVLVLGGHNGGDTGIKDAVIFNQTSNTWSRAAKRQGADQLAEHTNDPADDMEPWHKLTRWANVGL